MAGTRSNSPVEMSSEQLQVELIEIKERLGSLETINGLVNREAIESLARRVIKNEQKKELMRECQQPQTRAKLMERFNLPSAQALDHHLNPLRENDLLHQGFDSNNIQNFCWSKLFKTLPKSIRDAILE